MSCADYSESIAELVDGTLDPARQRVLERHAEGCAACRALVADLKSIQAAAFTLDRIELPPLLWPRLKIRIAEAPLPGARGRVLAWPASRTAMGVWAAAAAALVLATCVGIYSLLRPVEMHDDSQAATTSAEGGDDVASVAAELEAAEQHYDRAIEKLEQIARSESGALDPQVAGVLLKALQEIDHAIGESRAALQTQPASADAQESLFESMRSKVALLQQTVELINEMRKGNQAEAGRLRQGLNQ